LSLNLLGWMFASTVVVAVATAGLVLLGYLRGRWRNTHGRESP